MADPGISAPTVAAAEPRRREPDAAALLLWVVWLTALVHPLLFAHGLVQIGLFLSAFASGGVAVVIALVRWFAGDGRRAIRCAARAAIGIAAWLSVAWSQLDARLWLWWHEVEIAPAVTAMAAGGNRPRIDGPGWSVLVDESTGAVLVSVGTSFLPRGVAHDPDGALFAKWNGRGQTIVRPLRGPWWYWEAD